MAVEDIDLLRASTTQYAVRHQVAADYLSCAVKHSRKHHHILLSLAGSYCASTQHAFTAARMQPCDCAVTAIIHAAGTTSATMLCFTLLVSAHAPALGVHQTIDCQSWGPCQALGGGT